MAVADITLTNPNVNGGTPVVLGGARVSYSWKNIYDTNTVPCKYDISEASFNGFESPIITIEGTIPIDDLPSNHITQTLLVDFAACKSGDTYLKVTSGKTGGTILGGRPSGGYDSSGNNTLDTTNGIKVQITGFNINIDATLTREGEGWFYSINFVETI